MTIAPKHLKGPSRTETCDNGVRDIYGDSDNVTITANEIYYCFSGINALQPRWADSRATTFTTWGSHAPVTTRTAATGTGSNSASGAGPLMTIDANTILLPFGYTDAIMLANDDGAQTNRKITNNLLAGGSYTFYGSGGSTGKATNIVFTGNQFSTGYFARSGAYGPVAHWQNASGNVWSNNTWADGPNAGQPVTP